jgi:transposase
MAHRQRRSRRSFSDEFKRDAVALVTETGRPIARVAEELGVYDSTLGNWVRQARDAEQEAEPLDEAQARIEQLEAELVEARRERDLLKRTVAFWVKESTP